MFSIKLNSLTLKSNKQDMGTSYVLVATMSCKLLFYKCSKSPLKIDVFKS